jgi:hypothetical protein
MTSEPALDGMQQLLASFGREVGLPDLSFDDEGHCVLGIDAVVVNLEHDRSGGRLLLYSHLGTASGDLAAVYASLLRASYLGGGIAGLTLGLRPADDAVVISRWLETAMLDLPMFQSALQTFVDTAEAWMARLPELGTAAGDTSGSREATLPPGLRA